MWSCVLCEATAAGTMVKRSKQRRDLCEWCVAELARTGHSWCAAARHKVPAADMAKGKPRCKACERQRQERYASGRDRRAYAAAWRAAHRDQALHYGRAYRAEHRDELNAKRRAYYWQHADAERARSRAKYQRRRHAYRSWRKTLYWMRPEAERADSKRRRVRAKLAILRGER